MDCEKWYKFSEGRCWKRREEGKQRREVGQQDERKAVITMDVKAAAETNQQIGMENDGWRRNGAEETGVRY